MKFVSSVSILLKSGKGGDGIIAWRRESKVRLGGPAGGSGGKGGSIYIEADENVNSLFHLRHSKIIKAENGENGRNKNMNGKNGEDLIIKVPCGTNIFNKLNNEKLFELIENGESYLVCKGGIGGRGNASFKSSKNSAPYLYELGDPSEEIEVFLDLESIADIGFLGMPNAGKSSLLSLISNAKPKIAEFPFTTLVPVLGTVSFENKKLIFADIPGLIEKASEGAGLGFEFLKHLNRCKLLIHLVDSSSTNLDESIEIIEKELKNYSEELFKKCRLLCFNKIDLLGKKEINILKKKYPEAIFVSVLNNENIDELIEKIFNLFEKSEFKPKEKIDYLEIFDDPLLFATLEIKKEKELWIIEHPALKYWIFKIPLDTHDNIARLFQKINYLGVEKELLKRGAIKGDEVKIYDLQYRFLVD